MVTKTVWYFEMTKATQLQRSTPKEELDLRFIARPSGVLLRELWFGVGEPQGWRSRWDWSDDRWDELAQDGDTLTWVGRIDDDVVGYFELRREPPDVQLHFFGLVPSFIGQGFGGALLTEAVTQAWQLQPSRVYLQTNNFDHEHAVANYTARGFRLYDTVVKDVPA